MAEKRRLAKEPMLYIAQPKFKPAEVSMQTSFRSQNSSSSSPVASGGGTSLNEIETRLRNQSAGSTAEKTEQPEFENTPSAEKESSAQKPRERGQRFQDLDLEGKVKYFFQLSPHVPKMKCEVSTEEEAYRGYITDYQNGIVSMKVFQRPYHQDVPFEKIKEIRLIGF